MADFLTALRSMPIRGAPATSASTPTLGSQAQSFGSPNAPALGAQAPQGPVPDMGAAPPQPQGGGPGVDALFGQLLAQAMQGGAPGQAPPAGGTVAPPQPSPPAGAMPPMVDPGMMAPEGPLPQGVTPPSLMITPPDSTFRQQFYAQNQRFPTVKDVADRSFVSDFVARIGRLPTKLEFVMHTLPQTPTDGPPEWQAAGP